MTGQPTTSTIKARLQELTGQARSGGTKDMAALLGIPLGSVHRYVRGPGMPPHEFLAAVADRYNVTLDWLYGRSDRGGLADAKQVEPAWARRLDARLRHLERLIAQQSAPPADASGAAVELLRLWQGPHAPPWAKAQVDVILKALREDRERSETSMMKAALDRAEELGLFRLPSGEASRNTGDPEPSRSAEREGPQP